MSKHIYVPAFFFLWADLGTYYLSMYVGTAANSHSKKKVSTSIEDLIDIQRIFDDDKNFFVECLTISLLGSPLLKSIWV